MTEAAIVPLSAALLRELPPCGMQAGLAARLDDPAYIGALCQPGQGWALVEGEIVLMVGGVVPVWPGRGLAWFAAAPGLRPGHWRLALRFLRQIFALLPFRRIEATVLAEFTAGCRWAEALGFKREGLMRRFGERGEDFWLYALIKPVGVK